MKREDVERKLSQDRANGMIPDFRNTGIYSVDLSGLDLSNTNFSRAKLTGSWFVGTSFIGANLSGADLTLTTLTSADFTDADLNGADLRHSTMENAIFYNTNLNHTKGIQQNRLTVLRPQPANEDQNEDQDVMTTSLATGVIVPLQITESSPKKDEITPPTLHARWENAREAAEEKNVLPALLHQIRRVAARDFLEYLANLTNDEGYVWVVYGASGSGKSAFFNTIEHQTDGAIRTYTIDGNDVKFDGNPIRLNNQLAFANYLIGVITRHKESYGSSTPLVIVLEEREAEMASDERSAICQALRNVLRSPKHGKNVIFVLPVTEPNQGALFLEQVRNTGLAVPSGQNQIYTFQGPQHDEHVDILSSQFIVFNDKDIKEYGLYRADLQRFVSAQQTIGQYIRVIREELARRNDNFRRTVKTHSYRPFTVITCFVNPLPGYRTEPTIKAMTINSLGRIRTGEILRTQSQKAQRWQGKHQALANVVEALDVRIVEITPQIVTRILYAYGGEKTLGKNYTSSTRKMIEDYLDKEQIEYHSHKAVKRGLIKQFGATNLMKIIKNEETEPYPTPRYLNKKELTEEENERKSRELVEIAVTRLVCESSGSNQHELHGMFSLALADILQDSMPGFKAVYPEASLSLPDRHGNPEKKMRPDIIIETQDKLFLLEFCWRSDEHFTYADISSYVLRKITDSYGNLPLIRALSEGALDI